MIIPHLRYVLIIDDESESHDLLRTRLEREEYVVRVAENLESAFELLEQHHFHVVLLDMHLNGNREKPNGDKVLKYLREHELDTIMDCIAMSAVDSAITKGIALGDYNALYYVVKKGNYIQDIIDRINLVCGRKAPDPLDPSQRTMLEKSHLGIKFNLEYKDRSSLLIQEVVKRVRWKKHEERPSNERLTAQVYDLLGKLFHDAARIELKLVTPGDTGASILKITCTKRGGMTYPTIVKVNRRYKVKREVDHYRGARDYFSGLIQQLDEAYTRDLGAVLYSFAADNGSAMVELKDYIRSHSAEQASSTLKKVFNRFDWAFKNRMVENASLPALYYEAFDLRDDDHPEISPEDYLVAKIKDAIPNFDANREIFCLPSSTVELANPIYWLRTQAAIYDLQVYTAYTHGDLTTRNVMVTDEGTPYLIDFYRTYSSHILRDFVILETDLKYRLLKIEDIPTFVHLEQVLHRLGVTPPATFTDQQRVTYALLYNLRRLAKSPALYCSTPVLSTAGFSTANEEFLVSLLMATLNITRFSDEQYSKTQKLLAMISAAMITNRLRRHRGHLAIPKDLY